MIWLDRMTCLFAQRPKRVNDHAEACGNEEDYALKTISFCRESLNESNWLEGDSQKETIENSLRKRRRQSTACREGQREDCRRERTLRRLP